MPVRYLLLPLFCYLLAGYATAQTRLSGRVTDERGRALPGANVFIRGSYDGANTDSTGTFRFQTSKQDSALLVVSYMGYEPYSKLLTLSQKELTVQVRLAELPNELNTVVITAGAFEASDEKRMTHLKAMDIVTTAGAAADITAAINFMPGAQRVGEQQGLFVRGGTAQEAKVVIDGLIVQNPFFSSLPDVQTRGRFDPFQFKGTSFSTGGYSAQYGQALSGLLLLNTTDLGRNTGLSAGLNLAGATLSYEGASERASVAGTVNYTNLKPLFWLVPQNVGWLHEPTGLGSSLTYRLKPRPTGLLKLYGMYANSVVGMTVRDPAAATDQNPTGRSPLHLRNGNAFLTGTYTDSWQEARWTLQTGFSYSHDRDQQTVGGLDVGRTNDRLQARAVLTRLFPGNNTLLFGTEVHRLHLRNTVMGRTYALTDLYHALFAEGQLYTTRKLAVQLGIRGEYSSLLNRFNVAPRLSAAYKTGLYSQVSVAAGQFYQTPDYQYLYFNPALAYERADHLIAQYQLMHNKRTFRLEAFYKNYAHLVLERTQHTQPLPGTLPFDANPYRFPIGLTSNAGSGYAQGFDVFWRDQTSIRGLDYWLTYSFVDTRRLFRNYLAAATPTFVSNHNLSLITKRYFQKIRTTASLTYAFSSGRPYYNPNCPESQFLTDRTPAVHNVSLQANYLTNLAGRFVVLYAAVENLLNTQNVFTYRYSPDGKERYAIGPPSYRSAFIGVSSCSRKRPT
jgi:hypothetical protein